MPCIFAFHVGVTFWTLTLLKLVNNNNNNDNNNNNNTTDYGVLTSVISTVQPVSPSVNKLEKNREGPLICQVYFA